MGRIQSNIGLITGVPIGETVDKLMELAARPRTMLQDRNKALATQQGGLTELTALLAATQYVVRNLGKEKVFSARSAASSDPAALGVTVTGSPPVGSWQFTPLRAVQNQQWLGAGLASRTDPIGAGGLTFRFGANVERGTPLELLDDGGFARGKIRITDRSGATAEIDLSTARTIDDVLETINAATAIRVTAVAHGDALRLIDSTGQAASNLQVEEVGNGRTAASLGLDGIDVAAATANGRDVVRLSAGMSLDVLNDGNGVSVSASLPDIEYTLRDGTTGQIDLSPVLPGGSQVDKDLTLGDVLDRINAAAPAKLKIEIGPDGDRLVVTDLTAGPGTFQLEALYDSGALDDLGLGGAAVGGTVTGRRLLGGVQGVLLSSLNGGTGLGDLGTVQLTDRSGASGSVDLAGAESLGEIVERINAAGLGIAARVNVAKNGVELADTTGQSGNLIVASGDATGTAEKLNLDVNAAVASVNSGDLHLQVVSESTLLAGLNGGGGVAPGAFTLIDSTGARTTVNLSASDIRTVGDAVRKINQVSLHVRAEINATGDGIALRDTGQGAGTLTVLEAGSTTAADLHLRRAAVTTVEEGVTTQTIDGSATSTVTWDGAASLNDVAALIQDLNAGVAVKVLSDGSAQPYRLSLTSQRPGRAGELVLDASLAGFDLEETVPGQDALMLVGGAAEGMLVSGSTNLFSDLLDGVQLEIKQAAGRAVTVTVAQSDTDFTASVKAMVDNYNKFRKRLGELTAFDAQTGKRSVLTGDATALRLDSDLSYLLSGRFGSGTVRTLRDLGIDLNDDGTLSLDESALKQKYAQDPEAVKTFFMAQAAGFAAKVDGLLEEISGQQGSLLTNRLEALGDKISQNQSRIDAMTKRLAAQRERLLNQFYQMELAIGKLQSNSNALSSIQSLATRWVSSK